MKNIFYLLVAYTLLIVACKNQNAVSDNLQKLLNDKQYFKLDAAFKTDSSQLDDKEKAWFRTFIDNAFNRNTACISDVSALLDKHDKDLPDSTKISLMQLQADSYFKTFQYALAIKTDSTALKRYAASLKDDQVDDIKNSLAMWGSLKNLQPQQTFIPGDVTVAYKRDKMNLIEIPLKINKNNYDGIFDTRANVSCVTQSYAKKMGIHLLNASYNEGSGITGRTFKSGLGIADSLYIGGVLVKNAVFQVMADSILYIAPIKFQMNLIVGFPIIEQLREIHLYKDGRMVIPQTPSTNKTRNLALSGLNPVIALQKGKDTLSFYFDSGASNSVVYAGYYQKYTAEIEKNAKKHEVHFGGAGGVTTKTVYLLPLVNLSLGDRAVTIKDADVLTQKISPDEKVYGNIGTDFISQFDEMIINFKDMFVDGK